MVPLPTIKDFNYYLPANFVYIMDMCTDFVSYFYSKYSKWFIIVSHTYCQLQEKNKGFIIRSIACWFMKVTLLFYYYYVTLLHYKNKNFDLF